MLSIKQQIKLKESKDKFIKTFSNTWYFLMKPLAKLDDKIRNSKSKKLKNKAKSLTDEEAINIISKYVLKGIIKYSDHYREFVLKSSIYNDYTIIEYATRIKKNKVIKTWGWNQYNLYGYGDKINDRILELTEMMRINLSKHEEVKCEYYQRDKYSNKYLIIKLKEGN